MSHLLALSGPFPPPPPVVEIGRRGRDGPVATSYVAGFAQEVGAGPLRESALKFAAAPKEGPPSPPATSQPKPVRDTARAIGTTATSARYPIPRYVAVESQTGASRYHSLNGMPANAISHTVPSSDHPSVPPRVIIARGVYVPAIRK